MALPIPILDDLTFDDLMKEARALILAHSPVWTDHNATDPGITLVELFAYLSEMLIYRLDRVTAGNREAFLRLLDPEAWTHLQCRVNGIDAGDTEAARLLLEKPGRARPDGRSVNTAVGAAIHELRQPRRAVNVQDFERLALTADARVARARCLPGRNLERSKQPEAADQAVHVSVVVVPENEKSALVTSLALTDADRIPVASTTTGPLAVGGFTDGSVRVWEVASGVEVRRLNGHDDVVNSVDVVTDGSLAVSASSDRTLRVWDVASGAEIRCLRGHDGPVDAVAMTPDGRFAVSVSLDQTTRLWDLSRGAELAWDAATDERIEVAGREPSSIRRLRLNGIYLDVCHSVAISADGRIAVSCSRDNVLVWDVVNGRETHRFQADDLWVYAVALTASGNVAATASWDAIRLWDVATGQPLQDLAIGSGPIDSLAITPDGKLVVATSRDGNVRFWDIKGGGSERAFQGHKDGITAVAISADGRMVVSGSRDLSIRSWDTKTGKASRQFAKTTLGSANPTEIARLSIDLDLVVTLAITGDGRFAVGSTSAYTDWARDQHSWLVRVWDLALGTEVAWDAATGARAGVGKHEEPSLRRLQGHENVVECVDVTPDGRFAVSGSRDRTIRVWDLSTGREVQRLDGHTGSITSVKITGDSRLIVSSSTDRTMRVWRREDGTEVAKHVHSTGFVTKVAVTPDGRTAVSATTDSIVRVWNLETVFDHGTIEEKQYHDLGGGWILFNAAVTPDARYFVFAFEGATSISVLDLEGDNSVRSLEGHDRWVAAVSLTPDGRYAVSAANDKTVRVWDIATGEQVKRLYGHQDWVEQVAVSASGNVAISGGWDRTLRVWDMKEIFKPPSAEVVASNLEERRLLTTRVHVAGPIFVPIGAKLRLVLKPDAISSEVREEADQRLRAFLNSLSGGEGGTGWPFGRAVYVSEIFRLVDKIPGVDFAEKISVETDELSVLPDDAHRLHRNSDGDVVAIRLDANELPALDPNLMVLDVVETAIADIA